MKADHVYKLSPRKETILSVDYGSMGTGSATCGQGTLEQYRLPSGRPYSWKYTIIPVDSSSTGKDMTTLAAKLRSDGATLLQFPLLLQPSLARTAAATAT